MPGSIKRKSQRAGGGCSWRNGGGKKSSIRKLKMRGGGSGHLHKKGGNRNSMRGGGSCGNHPKGRGRSMRGGGYGGSSNGSNWGTINKSRNMRKLSRKQIRMKRKRVIVDEEKFRKRR